MSKAIKALVMVGACVWTACAVDAGDAASRQTEGAYVPLPPYVYPSTESCPATPVDDCGYGLVQEGFFEVLPPAPYNPRNGVVIGPFESCPNVAGTSSGTYATWTGQQYLERLNVLFHTSAGTPYAPLPAGGPGVVRVAPGSAFAVYLASVVATDVDWNQPFCNYEWIARASPTPPPPDTHASICNGGVWIQAACEIAGVERHGGKGCQGNCER
jgi:hypothetical protein